MAARENQGLQFALIIFVILTIILIVTTYMFFSSYQQEKQANKNLTETAKKSSDEKNAMNTDLEAMKNIIGAAQTDKADDIRKKADAEIDKYGKGIPESNRTYLYLVEQLLKDKTDADARYKEVTARADELAAKLKADEAAKVAEFAKYTKQLADAAKELEEERKKFGQSRQDLMKQLADLTKKFEGKRKDFEDLTKKSSEEIGGLNSDNAKLKSRIQAFNDERLREQKANEMADGKITWINQRDRVVWINLGGDDHLRRQTAFSVFGKEDANPVEANRKGKIEVVRLIKPHLSEARIVEDDLSNPIMPGDQIFSPSWEAGRAEHFALAGFMDIDHDGESDRSRIRDLITLNGGVIDAEDGEDGKKTGTMSINTKYLVLGTEPTQEGKISGYSDMFDEAKTLGVKTMSVGEFMNYMGFRPEDRTVNLGKNAKSVDFKARLPEGVRARTLPTGAKPKALRKAPAPVEPTDS